MGTEPLVYEVSEASFAESVLANSHKLPVFVEFMAVWSQPCVRMADLFSDLAIEFPGQFIFAKVDVDENPAVGKLYQVNNIPTLVIFHNGVVVRTEFGQINETDAREFLKEFAIVRQSDNLCEQARAMHLEGQTVQAISLLTEAAQFDPSNVRIPLDMIQILLDLGEIDEAKQLLGCLPPSACESDMGKALRGQLLFIDLAAKTEGAESLTKRIEIDPADNNARFDLALCYISAHRYNDAMENLFYIQENEPSYKQEAAREMIVTVIHMLMPTDSSLAQTYRRKLSGILSAG